MSFVPLLKGLSKSLGVGWICFFPLILVGHYHWASALITAAAALTGFGLVAVAIEYYTLRFRSLVVEIAGKLIVLVAAMAVSAWIDPRMWAVWKPLIMFLAVGFVVYAVVLYLTDYTYEGPSAERKNAMRILLKILTGIVIAAFAYQFIASFVRPLTYIAAILTIAFMVLAVLRFVDFVDDFDREAFFAFIRPFALFTGALIMTFRLYNNFSWAFVPFLAALLFCGLSCIVEDNLDDPETWADIWKDLGTFFRVAIVMVFTAGLVYYILNTAFAEQIKHPLLGTIPWTFAAGLLAYKTRKVNV